MAGMRDSVAVVTGGTAGIGFAVAQELVAREARVVITGRRQQQLDDAVAALGERASGVRADVASSAEMDAVFAYVSERHGRLDTVVANAGMGRHAELGAITDEDFDQTFAINVKGVLHSVQKAFPLMRPGGTITVIASTATIRGSFGLSLYGGSKAAVRNFVRSWIQETAGSGIRINVISPGAVDTEALREALAGAVGSDGVEAQLAAIGSSSPLGRIAQPKEIAAAAVFLASAEASYIHGAELFVDGGTAQV
ncbi:short-chain dehydrogenase/reductase SDR [Parafrankia sp. EAN1pec]|uniref:SDR family NAD(P)-dependent oxidoreductase n=1 Tax=Parafrankia sp. (strain EAN1pec) TaxID=298653 RepID=UPI00005402B0|nr:short-chain dehydrogenase/reductase SDR [Frankia sp. EAN1pec]